MIFFFFPVITDNESESLSDEDIGENKSFGDLNEDAMFNQGMDTVEDFDEAAQIVEAVQFHFSQHESHSNPKIGERNLLIQCCHNQI